MNILLTTILKQYKLFPTNILALGDEEWAVWATANPREGGHNLWWSSHQMRGIVSSRDLVDQGKISNPTAKLYAQKLESYRITGLMQLSYALHGQINLIPSTKWWDLLANISKHTSPYGLVVLDVKLPSYYEAQSKLSSAPQITNTSITVSSWQNKKGSYAHNHMKLEAIPDQPDLYRKTQLVQNYYSMSLAEIKKLAGQYYETVNILDLKGKTISKQSNDYKSAHVILVCQKGWPDWSKKLEIRNEKL